MLQSAFQALFALKNGIIQHMEPLANKIRPTSLKEFVGQEHLVGQGKPLRIAIEQKHLFSFIFWGPPGVGKTTLARIYAKAVNAEYFELSAVSAGKEDIKKIVDRPSMMGQPKILFLDEIHRFNKAQQDYLLPFVETGKLYLIGATTENPSFEVIAPLLSRCRVFVLEELKDEDIGHIIDQAAKGSSPEANPPEKPSLYHKNKLEEGTLLPIRIDKKSKGWLIQMANGDARQTISMIENTNKLYGKITLESLKNTLQSKFLRYDKAGEEHYNVISAFIKSMRASQPNAALYYLARMVEAGEDPLFIARRMVVFASEDIGLAQPTALVVANAVFRACETIGYPECRENLAQGVAYLSLCKKDRSAYNAYMAALADVKKEGNLPVPLKVRNPVTKLMKDLDYGKDYEKYDEDDYLPEKLKGKKYL
jgi:putative ATPase